VYNEWWLFKNPIDENYGDIQILYQKFGGTRPPNHTISGVAIILNPLLHLFITVISIMTFVKSKIKKDFDNFLTEISNIRTDTFDFKRPKARTRFEYLRTVLVKTNISEWEFGEYGKLFNLLKRMLKTLLMTIFNGKFYTYSLEPPFMEGTYLNIQQHGAPDYVMQEIRKHTTETELPQNPDLVFSKDNIPQIKDWYNDINTQLIDAIKLLRDPATSSK